MKQSVLDNNLTIDDSDIIRIKGVTNELITSIGSVELKIFLPNNIQIKHTFHVMPDDIEIPSNGIIGKDFIKLYNCILDYGDLTFTIRTSHFGDFTIPINHENAEGEITIPPRCETKRLFKISCETFPAFIQNEEIAKGVFIANTIAHESEREISIVNSTDKTKRIKINTKRFCP